MTVIHPERLTCPATHPYSPYTLHLTGEQPSHRGGTILQQHTALLLHRNYSAFTVSFQQHMRSFGENGSARRRPTTHSHPVRGAYFHRILLRSSTFIYSLPLYRSHTTRFTGVQPLFRGGTIFWQLTVLSLPWRHLHRLRCISMAHTRPSGANGSLGALSHSELSTTRSPG
jgi:hypothetical protein